MEFRLATLSDIDQLIKMRWDFTLEDADYGSLVKEEDYEAFRGECYHFLSKAIQSNDWFIWVAVHHGKIVSHIYIELIQKVPRPGRVTYPFAFMTNVYTIPEVRGKGIGGQLIAKVNEWSKEQKNEFIIVWPSETSIDFYKRNGYQHCQEPMEFLH
ncbi:GNAT family N-acetyltransferase [Virgibacillus sp. NKC19-3]|uniref:GNAT family N-acetyltransferase n=1 Tax=Virgibacillus saliphilus TaxID=2831674 RepID=UPI001C9A54D9|nr:GNAT family N-acetyltransferase [Virgibacillus sp. NKC19-3]MBY7144840.1 GNAT family N-acetyltransferase [Virgibacillus sp. NKC19-3]